MCNIKDNIQLNNCFQQKAPKANFANENEEGLTGVGNYMASTRTMHILCNGPFKSYIISIIDDGLQGGYEQCQQKTWKITLSWIDVKIGLGWP